MSFTVYVITGPGGEYVGCTGQTLDLRFRNHVTGAHLLISDRSLGYAICQHGADAFSIRAICEGLTYADAVVAEREAIWARRMARVPTYNLRPGGVGLSRSRHLRAA